MYRTVIYTLHAVHVLVVPGTQQNCIPVPTCNENSSNTWLSTGYNHYFIFYYYYYYIHHTCLACTCTTYMCTCTYIRLTIHVCPCPCMYVCMCSMYVWMNVHVMYTCMSRYSAVVRSCSTYMKYRSFIKNIHDMCTYIHVYTCVPHVPGIHYILLVVYPSYMTRYIIHDIHTYYILIHTYRSTGMYLGTCVLVIYVLHDDILFYILLLIL